MNWFIVIFFIISLILFLITKYYVVTNDYEYYQEINQIETFETEKNRTPTENLKVHHNITINYLDKKEASKLITINNDYMQNMNQANLSARDCITINALYNKYKTAFDDITEKEKNRIDDFILILLGKIKRVNIPYYRYVVKWLQQISITKGKHWLESGMPHTLEKTIIMDANWFNSPRKTTFLHELTHIHQRNIEFEFEDLYTELGYYYNPNTIKGLESIYPLNRNNPDALSTNWLWKMPNYDSTKQSTLNNTNTNYWWIGALFRSITPSSLNDVNLVALKLDRDKEGHFYYLKQHPTFLNNLSSFITFFGENPNNYHPNEMTAKFAEFYLLDILNENHREIDKYEGYKIYKKYFETMINKYY